MKGAGSCTWFRASWIERATPSTAWVNYFIENTMLVRPKDTRRQQVFIDIGNEIDTGSFLRYQNVLRTSIHTSLHQMCTYDADKEMRLASTNADTPSGIRYEKIEFHSVKTWWRERWTEPQTQDLHSYPPPRSHTEFPQLPALPHTLLTRVFQTHTLRVCEVVLCVCVL